MPRLVAPQCGLALLVLGLLLSAVANGLAVAVYQTAFEGPLDWIFFFVAFTAGVGLASGGLGWLGGVAGAAVLRAAPHGPRARGLLALLLALPLGAYGLLAFHALARPLRSDVASLAWGGVVLAAAGALGLGLAQLIARGSRSPERPDRRLAGALAACALLAGAAFGLRVLLPSPAADRSGPSAQPAPGVRPALLPPDTNVLLLLVDTLRADHLSYAGYPRETSPAIDRLAGRAVRFDRVIGQATRTSPNMASLLTGTTPYQHAIVAARTPLPERLDTWAELLGAAGHHTAGILGNPNVGRGFRFTQGLDEAQELFRDPAQSRAEPMVRAAVEWLEARRREPFFLWLHLVDPHRPYDPPPPYDTGFEGDTLYERERDTRLPLTGRSRHGGIDREAQIEGLRSLADYVARYDGEIRYADHWIGALLQAVERLGLGDDTLIVFTSDHGESLGEHDYYFSHGTYPYEPTARVPLLLAHPELPQGRAVDAMVRTIDVLPTVLDLLGLPIPPAVEGRSLRPLFDGSVDGAADGAVHASITTGLPDEARLAARSPRWKLILTPVSWPGFDAWTQAKLARWPNRHRDRPLRHRHYRSELYDLEVDPRELRNVAGTGVDVEGVLRDRILTWVDEAAARTSAQPVDVRDIEPGVVERLRELGYVE